MNTPTITVRVPKDVQDRIKREAKERGVTLSDVVNERLKGPQEEEPFAENADVTIPCIHPEERLATTTAGRLCLVCHTILAPSP